MTDVSKDSYLKIWAQRWRDLTETQRNEYNARSREVQAHMQRVLTHHLLHYMTQILIII